MESLHNKGMVHMRLYTVVHGCTLRRSWPSKRNNRTTITQQWRMPPAQHAQLAENPLKTAGKYSGKLSGMIWHDSASPQRFAYVERASDLTESPLACDWKHVIGSGNLMKWAFQNSYKTATKQLQSSYKAAMAFLGAVSHKLRALSTLSDESDESNESTANMIYLIYPHLTFGVSAIPFLTKSFNERMISQFEIGIFFQSGFCGFCGFCGYTLGFWLLGFCSFRGFLLLRFWPVGLLLLSLFTSEFIRMLFREELTHVFNKCPNWPFEKVWKPYFRTLVEIYYSMQASIPWKTQGKPCKHQWNPWKTPGKPCKSQW